MINKYLIYLIILLASISFMIFGMQDDAPGAVLIGFIVIVISSILLFKSLKKRNTYDSKKK